MLPLTDLVRFIEIPEFVSQRISCELLSLHMVPGQRLELRAENPVDLASVPGNLEMRLDQFPKTSKLGLRGVRSGLLNPQLFPDHGVQLRTKLSVFFTGRLRDLEMLGDQFANVANADLRGLDGGSLKMQMSLEFRDQRVKLGVKDLVGFGRLSLQG